MSMLLPLIASDAEACRSAVSGDVLDADEAGRLAHTFKALGDPSRVRLLSLVASSSAGEACVCDLTEPLGLTQPTVSHHMKVLADAGLVSGERRGRWTYYRVMPEALSAAALALQPSATSS